MAQILIMIKPWAHNQGYSILNILDNHGRRVKSANLNEASLEDIAEHYRIYEKDGFFNAMVQDFVGEPLFIAVYEGDQKKFNNLKSEIRQIYDGSIPKHPVHERNSIHISDNQDQFEREYSVWKEYLK